MLPSPSLTHTLTINLLAPPYSILTHTPIFLFELSSSSSLTLSLNSDSSLTCTLTPPEDQHHLPAHKAYYLTTLIPFPVLYSSPVTPLVSNMADSSPSQTSFKHDQIRRLVEPIDACIRSIAKNYQQNLDEAKRLEKNYNAAITRIKKGGTKPYSPGTNLEGIVVAYYEDPNSEIAKLGKLEPHLQSSSIMRNTMDNIYRRSTQVAEPAH
jgi:hypothetical protein